MCVQKATEFMWIEKYIPLYAATLATMLTPTDDRLVGIVKLFDKMKGFGFVQQLNTDNDYFVHYSQLQSTMEHSTKYLVAGEYVEFNISKPTEAPTRPDGKSSEVAVTVSGISNGPLMHETQQQQRTHHRRDSNQNFTRHLRTTPTAHTTATETKTDEVAHTNPFDVLESA